MKPHGKEVEKQNHGELNNNNNTEKERKKMSMRIFDDEALSFNRD